LLYLGNYHEKHLSFSKLVLFLLPIPRSIAPSGIQTKKAPAIIARTLAKLPPAITGKNQLLPARQEDVQRIDTVFIDVRFSAHLVPAKLFKTAEALAAPFWSG
jgi:hypothetical protein